MSRFVSSLLISFCFILLLFKFLIISKNRFIGKSREHYTYTQTEAHIFSNIKSSCEATAQFRQTADRLGTEVKIAPIKGKSINIKKIKNINAGIGSKSKASPVADDTGIYVGSDTGWFYKLNFKGEVLWSFYLTNSFEGVTQSPAADDKKVYFGTDRGGLYALNKQTGELVWTKKLGQSITTSPLLADNALFISVSDKGENGYVSRVDCNTGQTLWNSYWLGGLSQSSPAFDKKNEQVLVGSNSGRLYAFSAATGHTRWDKQTKGAIKSTPLVFNNGIFFSSWDEHFYGLESKTGKLLWKTFSGGRSQVSLALVPQTNTALANSKSGEIVAINLDSGQLTWRLRHGDGNHRFSIVVTQDSNNKSLAWSRCKKYQLCILNAQSGKLIKNIDLPESFSTSPYFYKNSLYMTLDKKAGLYSVQQK